MTRTLTCNLCHAPARLHTGTEMYPHRPDLADVRAWKCTNCDGRVGCHPGTDEPLGTLATEPLRKARNAAHRAFDPIWKELGFTRPRAYNWLARAMGLTVERTHIGEFNISQCGRVVQLANRKADELRRHREAHKRHLAKEASKTK
jgi:hypothetical protein